MHLRQMKRASDCWPVEDHAEQLFNTTTIVLIVAFSRALQRVGCEALLCGFCCMQERTPDRLRRLDLDKTICRIKIVFSTFVNYADISVPCSLVVWNDAVDFVQLKRRRIAAVVDADRKPCRSGFVMFHGH